MKPYRGKYGTIEAAKRALLAQQSEWMRRKHLTHIQKKVDGHWVYVKRAKK